MAAIADIITIQSTGSVSTMQRQQPLNTLILFLYLMGMLLSFNSFSADATKPADAPNTDALNQATFLGAKILDQDLNSIRKLLWNHGGFIQAKSTVRQKNIDKFFPWSNLRENYYIECRYTPEGKLSSLYQLYRPSSLLFNNQRDGVTTDQVARVLQAQFKIPPKVKTKSWGGTGTYRAYYWENDKIKITVDRQGSERLGNVFVLYQIKPIQTFLAYQ